MPIIKAWPVMIGVFSFGSSSVRIQTAPYEAGMPAKPPSRARLRLSMMICRNTTRPVAPMALKVPISRMRSLMLASMMFMMPTPPTSRLSAAMMPRMILALAKRWLILVMALSCVWNPKSSIPLWVWIMMLRICASALSINSRSTTLASKSLSVGSGT